MKLYHTSNLNLCKNDFTYEIVFKTSRSTDLQAIFSKDRVSKKPYLLKPDLITRMIFRTHECVNTCVTPSFDKELVLSKFYNKL
ncbi:hypothetical protein HanPI659440_Chr15g0612661 [Helianthus annuus]|nr:hypothetical protein HanPI659440_Chr15g0612661 [Helianthus annuus]